MESYRPKVAITLGDPAGIGPEIVVKSLALKEIYNICRPVIIGDSTLVKEALRISLKDLDINSVTSIERCRFEHGTVDVYDLKNINVKAIKYGEMSPECGKAAGEYIEKTIKLAMASEVDATVTAPINKESLNKGGYHYQGHTEFYAKLTGTKEYSMMLAHENLRVAHVSTHVSLKEACELVKEERVYSVIKIAHAACQALGIEFPRIGVAGLNPHAGESQLMGDEEEFEIKPAIIKASKEGLNVSGPLPPDSVFQKVKGGFYDIGVAMYHDQGHIPLKMVGFEWDSKRKDWKSVSGVNVTLGLPIIRVAVDHGVAFGKAGKGIASPESMIQAIKVAVQMANSKRKLENKK